jgi:hypothetical protein
MSHSAEYTSLLNKLAAQPIPKAILEARGYRIDLTLAKLKKLSKSEAIDSLIAAYTEDFNAVTFVYDRTSKAAQQGASNTYQPKVVNISGKLTLYDACTNHPLKLKQLSLRGLGHKFTDDSGITFEYLLANAAQPPSEFDLKKEADLLQLLTTPTRYLKTLPIGAHKVKDWKFTDKGYKKSRIVELDVEGQGIVLGNGELTKTAQAYNNSWDRAQPAILHITGHGVTKNGNVTVNAFLNLPDADDGSDSWSLLDALAEPEDIDSDDGVNIDPSLLF